MAYAEKRANGSYRLRASCGYSADGRQVTRSKTWTPAPGLTGKKLEKELLRALDRFQAECDSCTMPGNVKFSVFADQWFTEYAEKRLKKSSFKRMKAYKARTYAAIGHLRMDKITARHVQQFINNLGEDGINETTGKGLAPKTIKCYLSFISDIFLYAIRMGMLKDNPCKNVVLPTPEQKEKRIPTLEEAQQLLESLENEPLYWRAFWTLAIYSGLRRGELLGLEWQDIDFDNRIITIARESQYNSEDGVYTDTPKTTSSRRTLKLHPIVFEVLRAHKVAQAEYRLSIGDQWRGSGRLFTGVNGEPMHPNAPYNWLNRFCKRTNQPFYGIHAFRHLNASLQISSGTDAKTVSANLGHSTVATTLNIYAHSFDEARARASEGVGDLLAQKSARRQA